MLIILRYKLLFFVGFVIFFSGCAETAKISISYTANKEHFIDPKTEVFISAIDERPNKEVFGDGAKANLGKEVVLGVLSAGVIGGIIFAAMSHDPSIKDKDNLTQIFKAAMAERLSKNGIMVTSQKESTALTIDLLLKHFMLDKNLATWISEVSYVAKIKKNGEILCENDISEKATAFNWSGFSSAEQALNEAFGKAIDKLDVNSCFSKL